MKKAKRGKTSKLYILKKQLNQVVGALGRDEHLVLHDERNGTGSWEKDGDRGGVGGPGHNRPDESFKRVHFVERI